MEAVITIAAVVFVVWLVSRHDRLAGAKQRYRRALEDLEQSPSSAQARKAALEAGRAFADEARRQAGRLGRPVFDEVALANDLSVRTGVSSALVGAGELKTCPDCCEEVRAAARKCRFCGYRFDADGADRPPAGDAARAPDVLEAEDAAKTTPRAHGPQGAAADGGSPLFVRILLPVATFVASAIGAFFTWVVQAFVVGVIGLGLACLMFARGIGTRVGRYAVVTGVLGWFAGTCAGYVHLDPLERAYEELAEERLSRDVSEEGPDGVLPATTDSVAEYTRAMRAAMAAEDWETARSHFKRIAALAPAKAEQRDRAAIDSALAAAPGQRERPPP